MRDGSPQESISSQRDEGDKMKRKIIIALAPTGGWGKTENNPVDPQAIAEDVIRCVRSGASVVHLHARDEEGRLTTDLSAFNKTVQIIKESCDIILEASTGGLSSLTAAERVLPAGHAQAQMGSLNIGSLNFGDEVYQNSLKDVRFWIKTMAERKVKPSLEIFDTGHMEAALHLISEGLIATPCYFSFIFDVKWGMPYHSSILEYLKAQVPQDSRWGALMIGSTDFSKHIDAAHSGANLLRVGFEDSYRYHGSIAKNNDELVRSLRGELEAAGFAIATAPEARALLLD
jgi:3-keto-5-aminohexanoate cleavage enzyme